MRVGLIQLTSTQERDANLERADKLIRQACSAGAELVVLPEMFNSLGPAEVRLKAAEPLDGPTGTWAAGLSRELGIHLLAGSLLERISDETRQSTARSTSSTAISPGPPSMSPRRPAPERPPPWPDLGRGRGWV